MAIVLDRPADSAPAGQSSDPDLSATPSAIAEEWAWEDDPEPPFPWARLVPIGALLGLGIGLPLIPMSTVILTTFGAVAGALGCPFHPLPPDLR